MKKEILQHVLLNDCEGSMHLQALFIDETNIYLVLDLHENGSLVDELMFQNRLTESQVKTIMI